MYGFTDWEALEPLFTYIFTASEEASSQNSINLFATVYLINSQGETHGK
jgi:hypothetical protein